MLLKLKKKKIRLRVNKRLIRKNYKSLIQYAFRKGYKAKMENIFRTLLFQMRLNLHYRNKFKFEFITKASLNTRPGLGVRALGRRKIIRPYAMTKSFSKFLSSSWLIKNAKEKQNRKFYFNLAEEFIESAGSHSKSIKNKKKLHKQAIENARNLTEDEEEDRKLD